MIVTQGYGSGTLVTQGYGGGYSGLVLWGKICKISNRTTCFNLLLRLVDFVFGERLTLFALPERLKVFVIKLREILFK